MESKPVFFDPRGTRGTWVTRLGAFLGSVVAVLSTLTIIAVLVLTPAIQGVDPLRRTTMPNPPPKSLRAAGFLTSNYRRQLAQEMAREAKKNRNLPAAPVPTIVAGFYAPWEASGLASLHAHASALTHIVPQWLHLTPDGQDIDFGDFNQESNPGNREVVSIARKNGLHIVPILDNQQDGVFDPVRAAKLFASEAAQKAVALKLVDWLDLQNGDVAKDDQTGNAPKVYQGINLDLELVGSAQGKAYVNFLKILRGAFDRHGYTLSIDVEADSSLPLDDISDLCDWLVLMAYDEHSESDPAGPLASIDWSQSQLDHILQTVPNKKLVLGMGNNSYDWTEGKAPAENLTFQAALTNAYGYRSEAASQVIHFDPKSANNTFEYMDDKTGKKHVVWMLDAVSAFDQWKSARDDGIRGAALWYLGAEDPSIWSFFNRESIDAKMDPGQLDTVKFPYEISFTGRGEILSVLRTPQDGKRTVSATTDGYITGCIYDSYAFPYVIRKSGYKPKKLALTFDDGPDPTWTPEILKVLHDYKAPGTFFVIGNSCEQHPGIVADEYAQGQEIGSHSFFHPNMGVISTTRDRLELNLTQLAIEAATGRSTILFRPPYNADSEPETAEQVKPIEIASEMGYVVVAENVDPQDWNIQVPLPNGGYRLKTGEDIASFIDEDLRERIRNEDEGSMLLLHDAGGDRSATVAALKILIPRLRSEGYEFVPVSSLMDTDRDHVMPPIPPGDRLMYLLARFVLGTTYGIYWILSIGFVVAIGLGLARVAVVLPLAILWRRHEKRMPPIDFKPPVTVLIAAFNEETVIARTIESVLHSFYPLSEIIVIDDGSSDGTAEAVRSAFGDDPRVRLISQENGGKASALNRGIEESTSDFLFCIDADTQLHPEAMGLTVRHFEDGRVGAVAGNVRVGNEVNVITYWQSLEYTTSQNLDRRAYAMLNAITVVPGAIGAWRKAAVQQVGGYLTDTLAEDMDLTWRLRRAGYTLTNETQALAYTEAPQSFRAFFRQRFRWAYGTLQCLYKHRGALFHYGWFGWVALPALWVFQVLFQALAPLVDMEVIISVVQYVLALAGAHSENGAQALSSQNQTMAQVGFLYALFFGVELIAGAIATRMERQRYGLLWWLFLQRFAYRQIMYGVIYRSVVRAVTGGRAGWGKIDRKGTVRVPGRNG